MKITIIRHGKVNMKWRKLYTSEQFDAACDAYDLSSIYPINEKADKDVCEKVYISSSKRTRDTAEQLFGSIELVETGLLNEVPLKSFWDSKLLLPLWIWNILGRIQWLLGNDRQDEVRADTKRRADRLIEELIQRDNDCILITHGFFMKTLVQRIRKQDFVISNRKLRFKNLEKVIAEK